VRGWSSSAGALPGPARSRSARRRLAKSGSWRPSASRPAVGGRSNGAGRSPGGRDTTWDRDWARLDGWKRWLTVADSGHVTFIDLPVLGAQLGITDPGAPLSGQRSGEITRDYVGAFFDLHLRALPQPLLDAESPANPEVRFQQP
jgi:hypothetical protein